MRSQRAGQVSVGTRNHNSSSAELDTSLRACKFFTLWITKAAPVALPFAVRPSLPTSWEFQPHTRPNLQLAPLIRPPSHSSSVCVNITSSGRLVFHARRLGRRSKVTAPREVKEPKVHPRPATASPLLTREDATPECLRMSGLTRTAFQGFLLVAPDPSGGPRT